MLEERKGYAKRVEIDVDALGAEAAVARPFIKFAGGKGQLVPVLLEHVPSKFGVYFEPFVGGGSFYYTLHNRGLIRKRAVLGDANVRLINAYRGVRTWADDVIRDLRRMPDNKKTFLATRERFNKDHGEEHPAHHAARFLYLNRTCFNGLYRVNKKDEFNVPYDASRKGKRTICDEGRIRLAAVALREAACVIGDFEKTLRGVKRGDLVYADPPYDPKSESADFTAYTKEGFGPADQERLRDLMLALKKKGVHVIVSSPDTPRIRKLYARGFEMRKVQARRAINSKVALRGPVGEVILT